MKIIGVMTGNSLDAVDVVLTEFENRQMRDITSLSKKYPSSLRDDFLKLRSDIKTKSFKEIYKSEFFLKTVDVYTKLVAEVINQLLMDLGISHKDISAIGFHGQTLDHFPPSIAQNQKPRTLQVGNACLLAKLTGIKVIYDFRSDDILNGGEGAPLAPMHNYHIAQSLKSKGVFPVAFCNAGNTGNISVISTDLKKDDVVLGWDIGPFNHFSDMLVRNEFGISCDFDGEKGKKGKIREDLLQLLFDNVALMQDGGNFYEAIPPKSSDPSWYCSLDFLKNYDFDFYDVLRTVQYLSVYSFIYNLKYLPEEVVAPKFFVLFGGGWKNPNCFDDFCDLLNQKENNVILKNHQSIFEKIYQRLGGNLTIGFCDELGFSSDFMEARIFADLAYRKLNSIAFTIPKMTNCKSPIVCGVIAYPDDLLEDHLIYSRAADV